MAITANLGYPRIGARRELKRALEGYWQGKVGADDLRARAAAIRAANWAAQRDAGIDLIPANDFSLYDHVLDTIALVGAVPPRYGWDGGAVDLDLYFALARGEQDARRDVPALEMTKWFDTNYHYLVPEFRPGQVFRLSGTKPFDEFAEARALGVAARPVLLGPVSFLLLGKVRPEDAPGGAFDPLVELLDPLVAVYAEVVGRLAAQGAEWIQLDEPCFVQDRGPREWAALRRAYTALAAAKGGAKILVQTYFGHVGESYETLAALPVDGLGLDFVRDPENLDLLERHGFPADKRLAAGVVDGRNVWRADLDAALALLERLARRVPSERLIVGPSCSLQFVPLDIALEPAGEFDVVRPWLAFARQKLDEVAALRRGLDEGRGAVAADLDVARRALDDRRRSPRTRDPEVRRRLAAVTPALERRASPFAARRAAQRAALGLPPFPTTTIGSFPQTAEVRRARAQWKQGALTQEGYDAFIAGQIAALIRRQEALGLDVLVHGEFERGDMVEYFGEQLAGFALTTHGWVQSYGSRYVRPPILYGDVRRPRPMTVRWSAYAQSLTPKPVKAMLTGPVTILEWSFVRDDQPRADTARQVALALRDEVADLEAAGLRVIQIDEPALREGLPLRRAAWGDYLDWAVRAYRLASSGAADATQIHSHMCYSEFNDIIAAIADLDADVITIENSRSDLELLDVFRRFRYDHEIGPGVYDIHSPRVPPAAEMAANLRAAMTVLDRDLLWVNPDCGLKTRDWPETIAALRNMVAAAHDLRGAVVGV
ncbi:MAG TPA: 5-methyltetrahydropteroyltriglutamate--homocysteine S-methyltransferase [Thermomicrobiales bacterium]|nr:5-methyltetrahydropteroyltriglutamate--homocysteine S-methyltransferase [Thermomicrobiales bacterium]